jgi:hypothetical protein
MAYSDLAVFQVAEILQADGVGTFGTDIFISKEPETPDNAITIYKTGGLPDNTLKVGEYSQEIHNFQVRVRNNNYQNAHTVMNSVRASINNYQNAHTVMNSVRASIEKGIKTLTDSGGTDYLKIQMVSLPIDLSRDTTNRCIITSNFTMMRYFLSS